MKYRLQFFWPLCEGTFVYTFSDAPIVSSSDNTTSNSVYNFSHQIDCRPHSGDVVALFVGDYCCKFDWKYCIAHPDQFPSPVLSYKSFRDQLSRLVDKFLKQGLQPIFLTLPPVSVPLWRNFLANQVDGTSISQLLDKHNVDINNIQDRYNDILCQMAENAYLPLIDIRPALVANNNLELCYLPDGIHLNESGWQIVFSAIRDFRF